MAGGDRQDVGMGHPIRDAIHKVGNETAAGADRFARRRAGCPGEDAFAHFGSFRHRPAFLLTVDEVQQG